MLSEIARGVASGMVGTAALNIATYLDMAVRGRPPSQVPEKDVERLANIAGADLSGQGGDDETARNRRTALGALMGYVTGAGVGAVYGLVRPRLRSVPVVVAGSAAGAAAMAGSDVPSTLLGVTSPARWSATAWASDVVPHLAFGIATAVAYEAMDGDS